MKILFYDIKEFEFDYLTQNMPDFLEPWFFKIHLNSSTYISEKYSDTEAISVFVSSDLDSATLSKFKNLKYIFLRSAGFSNVDLKYCAQNNIKIYNTPHYGNSTIAEYVFALILNLSRKISLSELAVKKGEANQEELIGVELSSKTLGVIGIGGIGSSVVKIAQGFNMNPICYDINKNQDFSYVALDEIYEKSDFIVICCPLTSETRGLIGRNAFLKMKKEAILVNVARGEIVDTKELTRALVEKRIKGAALDVVECEHTLCNLWEFCISRGEEKENCLRKFLFIEQLKKMENVIITPHNAYNTIEAQKRILDMTLENITLKNDTKNLVML